MGKVKWSFSLIFAIFLVGILGTAAFASDTTDGHNVPLLNENNPSKTLEDGTPITLDKNGNGLLNSNETGFNNTRKQRDGQKMHGAYQNNTNSCASCHQTHTAQDNNLLFKNGVYSTCSACHDGTTGAYNSFTPTNENQASNSVAGTFDITSDSAHGSIHQADGSLKITSAPGGNSDSSSSIWNQDFDCGSCHASHGAGSADENNLNGDPLGWGRVPYSTNVGGTIHYYKGHNYVDEKVTKDNVNGKLFLNIPIVTRNGDGTIPLPTDKTPYILVKLTVSKSEAADFWYSRAKVKEGDQVIQTYRWSGSEYVKDYSLWLRETSYPFVANTELYNDSEQKNSLNMDSNLTIIWRDGFAFGSSVENIQSARVSLGIDVETTENIQSLYNKDFTGKDSKGTSIAYIPDSGVEMTKYCAACHTDYMTDPVTKEEGVLTATYRNIGVTDELTCVRCHFAHGTRASIMKDSSDQLSSTPETLSDSTHSSALRRYVNLTSLELCNIIQSTTSTSSTTSTTDAGTTSTSTTQSTTGSSNPSASTDSSTTSSTTNVTPGTEAPTTDQTTPATDSATVTP